MAEEEKIVISKKLFDYLYSRDGWLCELEAAGIDNTDAYAYAQEARHEEERDE